MSTSDDPTTPRPEPERQLTAADWARYFPYELRPKGFCPELAPPIIRMPGAPGPYACQVYLEGWVSMQAMGIEREDGLIMEHINACRWCHDIIYGAGIEFDTSIEEEVERRRKERRMKARRRFMMVAAAAVLVLGTGLGINALIPSGPTPAAQDEGNIRTRLEKIYARQGVAGIQALLQTADAALASHVIAWACETGKVPLYGEVVPFVADPRQQLRVLAITKLSQVAPSDLAAHKPALQAILQTPGYDPDVAPLLGQLIATIP